MDSISFYIPARNAERTLRECIQAVRVQTRTPDEFFIIVDPRSTDATLEIALHSGVRVIEQTGDTLGSARNQAIMAAEHRWLACCDSDVTVSPDWLERLAARRSGGTVGVGGRTDENIRTPFDAWRALHMPHHWGDHSFSNPFMLVSEVLFDRDALLSVGGYREDLNYYEDSDLCQRLRESACDLIYEPAALAQHQRTDTLTSLLTLRWKYSEYRQRHLLDRFAGLTEKLQVNREYALNSLSRSLARGHEELAYISFLLFFHHLLMDVASLLSRRPLVPEDQRKAYLRQLLEAAFTKMRGWNGALAGRVRADLEPLCEPKANAPSVFRGTPAWSAHLERATRSIEGLCRSLPGRNGELIEASAEHCHGRLDANEVPRSTPVAVDELQQALDAVRIPAFVESGFRGEIVRQWPNTSGIYILGPARASEHKALRTRKAAVPDSAMVAVYAHLESRVAPLGIFTELAPEIARLVVCYQPPGRYIPGLDVVTPADLASAATAAGWTIVRFDTLVGRVRLMLSKKTPTSQLS